MNARVILLAGPSGSGKTSLLRRVGAKRLKLDDFYRDGDEAGMPLVGGGITGGAGSREASRIDWDHPDSWDAERAMRAILDLCAVGRTEVPIYSIPGNAAVGRAGLDIGRAHAFVAEGVFAAELIDRCRAEGVLAAALVLRRPRPATWWFRLRRDLVERRKPPAVLLRRGLRLALEEPERVRDWMERGCRAVSRRQCEAAIAEHIGSFAVPGNRADGVM